MANGIINVDKLGALGRGDDTGIFQYALDSVPDQGGLVVYPSPVYVPTGKLTISKHRTHIRGLGIYATNIMPAASFSGAVFDFTKGAEVLYQCSLKGVGFVGAGTNQKIGIRASDFSGLVLDDVAIHQSWTGNGSIGLQTRGRDSLFGRNLRLSADIPISIEDNPNITIDADHFHFQDIYLTTLLTTGAAIQIAPNINLANITIDGTNSFCQGKYGIYWNDTEAPASTSLALDFQNIRCEQFDDATGYGLYINHYVQGVGIKNFSAAVEGNGFYLRNVKQPTLQNTMYYGEGEALNVNATCQNIVLMNCFEQVGTTRTTTGLTRTFNQPPMEIWQPS